MTRPLTPLWTAAAIALLASPAARSQAAADAVESRLVARKVVAAAQGEALVEATTARPGDVIEYTATYRNAGKGAVRGLQATLPIPPETQFVPGSARPAGARASVDGRTFEEIPLTRTVTREGRAVEERVPYREYRYLRWTAEQLRAGETVAYSARVRVTEDGSLTAGGERNAR
jgi:uncharacterized repeat protein (TIGR01451 family)